MLRSAPVSLLAAALGAPLAGQAVTGPVVLEQISWQGSSTGTVLHSEYGELRFPYHAGPPPAHFANVVARNVTLGTAPQQLVSNMPVVFEATPTPTATAEAVQVVDLRLLGITRGVPAAGSQIEVSVTFDPLPIPGPPTYAPLGFVSLGSRVYEFGGEFSPIAPTPSLPTPLPRIKPPWNGVADPKVEWRTGLPNIEQGTDQCGPAALTNSMHWLDAVEPGVNLGGETTLQTLTKLKGYTNFAGGIGQRDAIVGKLRYVTDPAYVFPPGFVVRYQADSTLTDLGASVGPIGGKTASRVGGGGAPDFGFLLSELQCGADVELSIDWLDAAGDKTGGHVVSVVGAMRLGNKWYVWTNDDANQGPKSALGVPPANGGLRTEMAHQVTIENGGYMRLSGFGVNNRVKATYSEKVPPLFPAGYLLGSQPGCPGSAGVPILQPAVGALPWIGKRFWVNLENVPSSGIGVWGVLDFRALTPPIDLAILGAPGCLLEVDPLVTFALGPPTGAPMSWPIEVPPDPLLGGVSFVQQFVISDLLAPHAFKLTVSNSGTGTVGVR